MITQHTKYLFVHASICWSLGIPFAPHMDPWVVLKRMHLDDNCKAKGSTIQAQVQAQSHAQAHVQRILAGMAGASSCGVGSAPTTAYMPPPSATINIVAPLASTVPVQRSISAASVYGNGSGNGSGSGFGSGASSHIHSVTNPTSKSTTSYISNGASSISGNGGGNATRRLTGQAWYDQSASRAVNQVPTAYFIIHIMPLHLLSITSYYHI
jgi:hypothetical protein